MNVSLLSLPDILGDAWEDYLEQEVLGTLETAANEGTLKPDALSRIAHGIEQGSGLFAQIRVPEKQTLNPRIFDVSLDLGGVVLRNHIKFLDRENFGHAIAMQEMMQGIARKHRFVHVPEVRYKNEKEKILVMPTVGGMPLGERIANEPADLVPGSIASAVSRYLDFAHTFPQTDVGSFTGVTDYFAQHMFDGEASPQVMEPFAREVGDVLDALPRHLIHGDLHGDNVLDSLFTGTTYIDFARTTGKGYLMFDLGTLIRSLIRPGLRDQIEPKVFKTLAGMVNFKYWDNHFGGDIEKTYARQCLFLDLMEAKKELNAAEQQGPLDVQNNSSYAQALYHFTNAVKRATSSFSDELTGALLKMDPRLMPLDDGEYKKLDGAYTAGTTVSLGDVDVYELASKNEDRVKEDLGRVRNAITSQRRKRRVRKAAPVAAALGAVLALAGGYHTLSSTEEYYQEREQQLAYIHEQEQDYHRLFKDAFTLVQHKLADGHARPIPLGGDEVSDSLIEEVAQQYRVPSKILRGVFEVNRLYGLSTSREELKHAKEVQLFDPLALGDGTLVDLRKNFVDGAKRLSECIGFHNGRFNDTLSEVVLKRGIFQFYKDMAREQGLDMRVVDDEVRKLTYNVQHGTRFYGMGAFKMLRDPDFEESSTWGF